ncbi:heavy metal translocating P-type ATPase [Radiobacillus deserti]|uniref:Cd(2+)-exporting ATPase n=1 Tax=Radiobacillus deserti TaxID=2594883 RepID=A0A516KDH0_9BACI|nr:heavy metal translocating P-type ATPase [Radiobacillus deserti]QDP39356.1 cadmium-translocating P-type ATPase [Radiobacillus deserti]
MSDSCCKTQKTKEEASTFNGFEITAIDSKSHSSTTCCESTSKNEEATINTSCCSTVNEKAETITFEESKKEKEEYRVHGMDCPSCATTLEKGIRRLKEVQDATVHYGTSKLQVVGTNGFTFDVLEQEVQKLGFHVEPITQKKGSKTDTFEVAGMDCGNCAQSIANHVNKIPSVHNVQVSFATGKMKVDHDDHVENIISEVAKIGYKASLVTNIKKQESPPTQKHEYGLITFTGILIAFGFLGSYLDLPSILSSLLYAVAIGISGYKPFKSAFYAIKSRSLDMNVLMSVAVIGAVIIGEWFEGATVIWLFALGTTLQNRSIEQTRRSIRNLMDLAPSEAWIKDGVQLVKKPVEEVQVGDIVVIKPGDRVPLDGTILTGESSINQAPITGESIPVDKFEGDSVYAGTINESGSLEVEVTNLVEDTTISKIIHLVEEAQEQKAPTQAFIDKFASIYTPVVFVIALIVIVAPPLFGLGTWGEWVYKGLALLVVACPCALVISTPVAIVSAIGNAAKNGVLVKGGTFLEKAGAVNAIAFDKTGTLTEGKPKVSSVHALTTSEENLLSIALTLEDYSTHPIAKAIADHARNGGILAQNGSGFKNIVGKGVQATIDDTVYYAGNIRLFEELNLSLDSLRSDVDQWQSQGKSVVIIGTNSKILGVITVSDTLRKTTVQALTGLKQVGMKQVIMLTGDNKGTAKMISNEVNVTRYFAELLPEDKVNAIKSLQQEGYKVAMVGDGINDAPALATSDLGIAMGGAGTDTAMETADIVLMADNMEKLPHTVKLSRKALAIIKQNIWFSIIVKLAALVFIFPGWLTLWMAVLSDTGAAIIVILNSFRLLKMKD